ncbi:MAG: HDOD domain-containing protein, partial [Actinomycetota bacterium]
SVDQAVAVAGFGAVESMVLSVGVTTALPSAPVDGFDNRRFWWAASRRATVARAFALELHPVTASLSFTAGLLQDMAVPMLAAARPDYGAVLTEWHAGGGDLHELERSKFGWSHDLVADWLCAAWELPEALSAAISAHHDQDDDAIPAAVRLVAPFREVEHLQALDLVVARASEGYGMDPDRVVALILEAEAEAGQVAAMFV